MRRSINTVMVLFILLLVTRPVSERAAAAFTSPEGVFVFSVITLSCLLVHDGAQTGNIAPHLLQIGSIRQLCRGLLHAQIELLTQHGVELLLACRGVHRSVFFRLHR